ncbi:hypothetical protein J4221_02695 [Candidatus Pacearchaeota archaeon]|nr:hypothetical protein [Candidatus Pacearchaeota archaeon]
MKKRARKLIFKNRKSSNKNIWLGIIIIILLLGAFAVAFRTSYYGVALGILIGFLVSHIMNKMRT